MPRRRPSHVLLVTFLTCGLAPLGLGLSATPAVAAPTAATVSSTASPTSPLVGSTLVLRGSVRPARTGSPIIAQQSTSRGWIKVASSTTSSTGQYALRVRGFGPGRHVYRVAAPATPEYSAGYSRSMAVTAYRWRLLLDVSPVPDGYQPTNDTLTLAGKQYTRSLGWTYGSNDAAHTFDLTGKGCKQLLTLAGAENAPSDSTNEFDYTVQGAGSPTWQRQLTGSATAQLSTSLASVNRFALNFKSVATGQAGASPHAGFGRPEVLCAS